jgi:hypothetical protein
MRLKRKKEKKKNQRNQKGEMVNDQTNSEQDSQTPKEKKKK